MKIKQTIKSLVIGALIIIGSIMVSPITALAADPPSCGGVQTSILTCEQKGEGDTTDSGVWGLLLVAINLLTAGIAIAAIGGIIYGAILYTSAGGSPEQVKKAKGIITNVVIGIVAYALMYSGLNFLIPGGLFA